MSQTALVRFGANPDQDRDAQDAWSGDLKAGFEAFGDKDEWPDFGQSSSEAAYLPPATIPGPAANEHTEPSTALALAPRRRARPELPSERLRLDARVAAGFIQGVDWLIVAATAQLAALWGADSNLWSLDFGDAAIILACALSLKVGLWLTDSYRARPCEQCPEHDAGGLALGAILGVAAATALAPDARTASALAALLPMAGLLLAGAHAAFALWVKAAHKKGAFAETVVLIGATEAAERFMDRAVKTGDARVVAVFDDRLARAPLRMGGAPVAGGLDDLLDWPSLPSVDRIVIAITQKAEPRVRALIEKLRGLPHRIDLVLDYAVEGVHGRRIDTLAEAPMARISGGHALSGRVFLKRVEDLVLGSALLAVFSPLMALIALAVRLDSPGPIIFKQRRHGFNNRAITVFKFRTMRHDDDAPLRQVTANDPRVTRIGAFLRRTSLDELPQLINVLRGEMSLVGPRPHAIGMRASGRDLDHIVAEYAHRHRVKPGITGWAQINGSRGPIEEPKAVRERVRLDLDYVKRASLWFDLWILLRTAPALLGDRKTTR